MDLQTKNKIPVEYQEAFELGLFGDRLPALNLVFNLLEEKLHLFGLAWSVAIFFEDSLGADRWLRRASKILEDHRNSTEKTIEEEALYMIESYMRIRSRDNIVNYTIPDSLLKIKQLIAKLTNLTVDNIRDEKSTWTRFLKTILLVDLHITMDTRLDSEDLESLIDDLIEYDPSNEYYWYLKGLMEPSSNGFNKALELNPKLALVYFQQAKEDLQCCSIKDAISQLDKAIEICPRFADAHLEKASALQQISENGEKTEIIKHMDIGIELDPENADYYYKKGYFLVDLDEFEDAAKSLNKALEFEPTYGGAYNQLAYIHISQNQFAAAIRAYLNAIKLNSDVKQNFANITRAMSNLDNTESNTINEEIIQCLGSMAPTDNNVLSVVDFMEIRGEDESALKFLEKAQNPSPKILYNMGMVLKRLGRYQEAIEKFQKILDVVTNPVLQAPAYEAIGWIYANKLQDPSTGLKYITKSMQLSKRYPIGVTYSVRDPTDPEASGEFIIRLK